MRTIRVTTTTVTTVTVPRAPCAADTDPPAAYPMSTTVTTHVAPPSTFAGRNRLYGIPTSPAVGGTSARITPIHRPAKTDQAPRLCT